MLEIATGVVAGLQVDGQDYPLQDGSFKSIQLVSNSRLQVMSAVIVLSDLGKFFNTQRTIGDGTQLTLQLGRSSSTYNTYNLRVFSAPSQGGLYTITAYWDSYKWFMESAWGGINGTSSDAIVLIAKQCGLKSEVDNTADSQSWRPGNKRNCVFARNIADHSYASDKSLMMLGMTMNGTIRYKDLSLIQTTNKMPVFLHTDDLKAANGAAAYPVVDAHFDDSSGFNNARGGYASQMIQQSVTATEDVLHSNVNVRRLTQQLNINKGIHSNIKAGRVEVGLLDCGNVHENWHRAQYQNTRAKQTYSMAVSLMTQQMTTDLDLFDPFLYTPMLPGTDGQITPDERNKAVFIVTAKSIKVAGGNYFERFEGLTQGPAIDPSASGSLV